MFCENVRQFIEFGERSFEFICCVCMRERDKRESKLLLKLFIVYNVQSLPCDAIKLPINSMFPYIFCPPNSNCENENEWDRAIRITVTKYWKNFFFSHHHLSQFDHFATIQNKCNDIKQTSSWDEDVFIAFELLVVINHKSIVKLSKFSYLLVCIHGRVNYFLRCYFGCECQCLAQVNFIHRGHLNWQYLINHSAFSGRRPKSRRFQNRRA